MQTTEVSPGVNSHEVSAWKIFRFVLCVVVGFNVCLLLNDLTMFYLPEDFAPESLFEPTQFLLYFDIESIAFLVLSPVMVSSMVYFRNSVFSSLVSLALLLLGFSLFTACTLGPLEMAAGALADETGSGDITFYQIMSRFWELEMLDTVAERWALEFPFCLISCVPFVTIGYAALYYKMTEIRAIQSAELQQRLLESQREMLRYRLGPHFLFNTLNTIGSLTITAPDVSRECIASLGKLLRYSLEDTPDDEVALKDEIENLRDYLNIQKARLGDRLRVEIDVASSSEQVAVPKFLLQPLVENSFVHGFRESTNLAKLRILVTASEDICLIQIEDNGSFSKGDQIVENNGIGITRRRLELNFGESSSILFAPATPNGLKIQLRIPIQD